jgi:predicted methyltransferase
MTCASWYCAEGSHPDILARLHTIKEANMNTLLLPRTVLAAGLLLLSLGATATLAADKVDPALQAVINNPARTASFVSRDSARHPAEELTFFGLAPEMTVVELWPGGGYWTEMLGPYLAAKGHYYVALSAPGTEDKTTAEWRALVAKQGSRVGKISTTVLGKGQFDIAPADSADLVLTFRNLHNWMDGGYADQALAACFRALKPGGVLGIEEHRGRNDRPQDPKAKDGYVRQDYTIAMAKKAGFVLAGSSEIDANPKDTKDWADGVWTLPPTLSQGEKDRARYMAVGEADNFVLKFTKPRK